MYFPARAYRDHRHDMHAIGRIILSTAIYEKMSIYEPFAIILVLTACFRRMMGFSLAKTIWRSTLTVSLYYIMLGLLIGIASIVFVLYLYFKGFLG